MTTDSLLMKRRPKAQVRPSRKSSAMAPRAQDLGWVGREDRDIKDPLVVILPLLASLGLGALCKDPPK